MTKKTHYLFPIIFEILGLTVATIEMFEGSYIVSAALVLQVVLLGITMKNVKKIDLHKDIVEMTLQWKRIIDNEKLRKDIPEDDIRYVNNMLEEMENDIKEFE